MKMLLESESYTLETEIALNESEGEKKVYIQGKFASIGIKNRNGRIYPRAIWEKEVARYKDVVKAKSIDSLLEYDHPEDRVHVDPLLGVARMVDIYIEGDFVYGKAVLLDTPNGKILQEIAKQGIPLSVSSRGVGQLGGNGSVEIYTLTCFDIVSRPSDRAAYLESIRESIEAQEYDITEEGNIVKVCSKNTCIMEHRDVIDTAVISKFKELFEVATEVSTDSKTPMRVPASFSNVTVEDFLNVMKMINSTDKIARYLEISKFISDSEDPEAFITFQTIRRINQGIRSKRYIKSVDTKETGMGNETQK